MNQSRVRAFGEVIGVAAVVASLIFVGLEIRQNAEATRGATVQEVTDAWREWAMEGATNPAAEAALQAVLTYDDFAEALPQDLSMAQFGILTQLTIIANAHYHFRQGLLPEEFWYANLRILDRSANELGRESALWRWIWERYSFAYPEPFQELVDSVMAP